MGLGIPLGELAVLVAALAAGGALMGLLAGLFGIGGGAIIVPLLYELFRILGVPEDIRMQLAVGTSLAVIIPTTFRSHAAHRAKGAVEDDVVRRLGPFVVGGVVVGIWLARFAPAAAFKWIWVAFCTVMTARLLFARDDWRLGQELPRSKAVEAYGVLVGFVSTLLSIGGGTFITTLLMLYNRPIARAVATATAFGPLIAIPGALGFMWAGWGRTGLPPLSIGFVNFLGFAALVPTSVMAAPLGVRLAHGLPKRRLELLFAAFLGIVGLRFLWSLIG